MVLTMVVQQSPLSCSQGLPLPHLTPTAGPSPRGGGGYTPPQTFPTSGEAPWTLPSGGAHADPLVMPLAFALAATFPKLSLCGCLLPGFNPASVLPSHCVGSPTHGHPIPKELSLAVEVPLGVSWLFPRNEALVVYSKALGVLCFARDRPGSRAPTPSS